MKVIFVNEDGESLDLLGCMGKEVVFNRSNSVEEVSYFPAVFNFNRLIHPNRMDGESEYTVEFEVTEGITEPVNVGKPRSKDPSLSNVGDVKLLSNLCEGDQFLIQNNNRMTLYRFIEWDCDRSSDPLVKVLNKYSNEIELKSGYTIVVHLLGRSPSWRLYFLK